MIPDQELPVLAKICTTSSFLHATKYKIFHNKPKPFKTLDKNGKSYISSKLEFRWYLYLLLIILSYVQYSLKKSKCLEETVLFWMCLCAHVAFLLYTYVNETKPSEITLYINSLYEFESIFRNSVPQSWNKSFQIRMGLLWINCGVASIITFPIILVYGLHWTNHCKTTLLGYWLLEECRSKPNDLLAIPNAVLKILVFFINHWMWAFGSHGVQIGLLVINTLGIICLHEFIDR